jgi:hypothetical protein
MQLRSGKVTSAPVFNWPTLDLIKRNVSHIQTADDAVKFLVYTVKRTNDASLVFLKRRAVLMGVELIRKFKLALQDHRWSVLYKSLIEKLKPFPHLAEYIAIGE